MSYTNVYPTRINWENEPSISSPINATNLNKIDYAVYQHDRTLETWDTTKANQSDLLLSVKSIDYDTDTGVFVFTWQNGTTETVDLNIEKIPVSFSMDANGVITMTTDDGTQYTADVGALIKTYTFTDSSEIDFTVTTDASGNKTITAGLVSGSITGDKLEPNYLANCQSAANSASGSATTAGTKAQDSEAWAVGERGGVPVPSTDPAYENNAKWYAEHGTGNSLVGLTDTDITSPTDGQALIYDSASTKWKNKNVLTGSTVTIATTESTLYGQTITLSNGGAYTRTATFNNYGLAIFQGVTVTGTVTLTTSDGSQTATRTLDIPYFGNYTMTITFFEATITVTYPSGGTCSISDGTTTLNANANPMAFSIPNAGTWKATATVDGVSKDGTSIVISTSGQTATDTIVFGEIDLTYDNEFRGLSLTCSDGVTTITKTAPNSGNTMTFYPPNTGTWTITGTYSGTPYSVDAEVTSLSTAVSVQLQTLTQITVTMYSAVEDTVTFTDKAGVAYTETFATGQSSKSVSFYINSSGSSTIEFTSSVAKNPDNLSEPFSKSVTITSATTEIRVMPTDVNLLYWWGYVDSNCEDCTSTNGWTNASQYYPLTTPTHNKNSIRLASTSSSSQAIGSKTSDNVSKVVSITTRVSSNNNVYAWLALESAKRITTTDYAQVTGNVGVIQKNEFTPTASTGYACIMADNGKTLDISALWYE